MKRTGNLYNYLISDENIREAINEVNKTHRWLKRHKPNKVVAWVESDINVRIAELRNIIESGFVESPMRTIKRYDRNAGKWREINEPKLWPDQYIHHILIQALKPTFMRGMDKYCCGSIRGRGPHYGKHYIEKWMRTDFKGTKYCAELDIHHFYQSLKPEVVMERMRNLIKDHKVLDLIWRVIKNGIKIGLYTSQWFANVTLQPLDMIIRTCKNKANHYIRYMDNFTLFSANKRKLRRLKTEIENWLNSHGLKLKDNWQIFATADRKPNALGFRYDRDKTLLRKKPLLRVKRQINKCYKKKRRHKRITPRLAGDVLSSIGQFKHWDSTYIREKYIRKGLQKMLKSIVREWSREERKKWNISLET